MKEDDKVGATSERKEKKNLNTCCHELRLKDEKESRGTVSRGVLGRGNCQCQAQGSTLLSEFRGHKNLRGWRTMTKG